MARRSQPDIGCGAGGGFGGIEGLSQNGGILENVWSEVSCDPKFSRIPWLMGGKLAPLRLRGWFKTQAQDARILS